MKWFVHVAADYYNTSFVIDANSAREAYSIALAKDDGNSYGNGDSPACAVCPFDSVLFFGDDTRVHYLRNGNYA